MEKIEIEDDENFDKIKVFSSEDEKLKLLGELLSNKSSRDIIKLLMNKEHYTNEIAKKLDLRPNLVIHHLKKLESLGLLETTKKRIVKKGNEHRYFRINLNLFITSNNTKDEIEKKGGIFQKIFKDGVKFVAIGLASFFLWTFMEFGATMDAMPGNDTNSNNLVLPMLVLILGLVGERVYNHIKKRKG